ncbi:TPA: ead/Ea22-like family protein [Escherichia coli]|nr:ead/Ea22-like family protein [Escherichia coli]
MSKIDYQVLREAAEKAKELGNISRYTKAMIALLEFKEAATPDAVLALLDELEAAKKRIAELEAREILLPERSSMLHRTDFNEDYQTVMAYKVSEVIAAIRAAGIRIKGGE